MNKILISFCCGKSWGRFSTCPKHHKTGRLQTCPTALDTLPQQKLITQLALLAAALVFGGTGPTARSAEPDGKAWLAHWQKKNPSWRALHLLGPNRQRFETTRELVSKVLVPYGFNVLILEVDYGFRFGSHPELDGRGLDKAQARQWTELCRKNGIRLIPLFNCLGHQTWGKSRSGLLKKYPQFDELPGDGDNGKPIYCREWCPSHPDVDRIVFDLLDELLDAFDADAIHVGMDEVFLMGSDKCPRCRGKDKGDLFAGAVNRLHAHLAGKQHVEMLMWGDRLLDASVFKYGNWESSATGSHRAIDRIPRDIIVCDWHYEKRKDYPSVRFFAEKGFRVLPSTWKNPEAAAALVRCARAVATDQLPEPVAQSPNARKTEGQNPVGNPVLGILFTGWSAGGNGEHLLAAIEDQPISAGARTQEIAKGIAASIRAGVKEWEAAGKRSAK